ncbi:MAG: ABC transporter substrate-binding protein [Planctomycetota bacterium]|nr:MAG: ABC transporter substrate-binding protein [Planctomycetota bacterium]
MTYVFELVSEALRNILRHSLRSFLTALGIIFGVASVMSMMSTGEGARQAILTQIEQLGITNIILNAKKPPESSTDSGTDSRTIEYGLTWRDAKRIKETLPGVVEVLPVHDVQKWIWDRSTRFESKVRGVTPGYFEHLRLEPILGSALTQGHSDGRQRVCVVRERLLRDTKMLGDPLKLDLKIGNDYYRVVGVLPDFEFQSPNKASLGIDDRALEVYVPYETVVDRFGLTEVKQRSGSEERSKTELHQIVVAVVDEAHVLQTARGIQRILEAGHPDKDYETIVPLELLASAQQTQKVFNIVLPIIAGISLLVGGIGILNIMLASITERTQEIGIRRALGATGSDITMQFLVETVTLAAVGGLLGVALGLGGVWLVKTFTEWNAIVTPFSVALSMGISCLTGVVFGLYPARRAAAMDPIEALRHE